ncbi:MAG: ABC transporter permease, partial [Actinomycetota bacterium]|nr:ABC transporter permease [Actinomycetota bacterium]
SGMAVLLSALNVYLRDIQHFLELALLAWFWLTPVIYLFTQLTSSFGGRNWPVLLNPVTPIVLTFQRALYGAYGGSDVIPLHLGMAWHLRNLAVVTVAATALLVVALHVFRRLEGNLAEEL